MGDPDSLLGPDAGAAAGGSPAWRLALGGKAAHLVVKELYLGDVLGERFVWRGKGLSEGILQFIGQGVVERCAFCPPLPPEDSHEGPELGVVRREVSVALL